MSDIQVSQDQFDEIAKGGTVNIKGPKGSITATIKKNTYTEVAFLLDESGSMGGLRLDTIGGFNTMLEEQQKQDGKATLTVAKFNTNYSYIHDGVNLHEAAKLNESDYTPTGGTALLDGIGDLIARIESRIEKLPTDERPSKVIVTIITDGAENSSKEWNSEKIKTRIEGMQERGWEFVFIGANQDAVLTARSYGINVNNAFNAGATKKGLQASYQAASFATSNARGVDGFVGENGLLVTNKLKETLEKTAEESAVKSN